MTQTIRPPMLLAAMIHWIGPATQGFAQLSMLTGLFTLCLIAMPVVIALNLLTKFLSVIVNRDR